MHSRSVVALGLLVAAAWAWALGWSMESGPADVWSALLIGPLLVLVSVPMVKRAAVTDGWRAAVPLLWVALLAKFVACWLRYHVAMNLYAGGTDSLDYHSTGATIAAGLRHGDLVLSAPPIGTEALELATGIVYAVIGPSLLGGYLVFGWMAVWGCWLFYRAFRTALPDGQAHRYAVVVLLLPSLLYWPASVGKESLMVLALGTASLGVARLVTGTARALPLIVVGLALAAAIRPHVALLVAGGILLALLLRKSPRPSLTSPVTRLVVVGAAAVLVVVLVSAAANFLRVDEITADSWRSTLDATAERTSKGGSEFMARPVNSVGDLPQATMTVLFRPWLWEVHNAQAAITSLEALLVLALIALAWRRLLALPRLLVREPYVTYAVCFTLLFVCAFSSFGNFGLLARERTQVLPFLLVLPFLPVRGPRSTPPVPSRARAVVLTGEPR
jgi:hypothetical protein